MFVSLVQVCVVYIAKKVRHSRELGQLMGVAHKKCALELQTSQEECKLPMTVVYSRETV